MGTNKILQVECDLKGCGKIFMIPDPPLKPTTGSDKIWSLTSASSSTIYWFCCAKHALTFLVAWIKATPEEGASTKISKTEFEMNPTQLKVLKEMGIIVETGKTDGNKTTFAYDGAENTAKPEEIPASEDLNLSELI